MSGQGALGESEFETFLDRLDRDGVHRYLSYSTGTTSVSRKQSQAASRILKRRKTRIVLVNESRVTMGLVAAARWVGLADIKVFRRDEVDQAVKHLGDPENHQAIREAIDQCLDELSLEPVSKP